MQHICGATGPPRIRSFLWLKNICAGILGYRIRDRKPAYALPVASITMKLELVAAPEVLALRRFSLCLAMSRVQPHKRLFKEVAGVFSPQPKMAVPRCEIAWINPPGRCRLKSTGLARRGIAAHRDSQAAFSAAAIELGGASPIPGLTYERVHPEFSVSQKSLEDFKGATAAEAT